MVPLTLYDITIIGHLGYDIVSVDNSVKHKCRGGAAYYSAVGASTITNNIAIISSLGINDSSFKDFLKKKGFETKFIKLCDHNSSEFVLSYKSSDFNNRTVNSNYGCGEEISFTDVNIKSISSKYFYISAAPLIKQVQWINELRELCVDRFRIAIDTEESFLLTEDKEKIEYLMNNCGFLFLNKRKKHLIEKISTINRLLYIVKKGKEGADVYCGNKLIASTTAPTTELVDSTASGDILGGSFMALLSKGNSIHKAIKIAVKIASQSITHYGVEHLLKDNNE